MRGRKTSHPHSRDAQPTQKVRTEQERRALGPAVHFRPFARLGAAFGSRPTPLSTKSYKIWGSTIPAWEKAPRDRTILGYGSWTKTATT